jgi:hypothetical protein
LEPRAFRSSRWAVATAEPRACEDGGARRRGQAADGVRCFELCIAHRHDRARREHGCLILQARGRRLLVAMLSAARATTTLTQPPACLPSLSCRDAPPTCSLTPLHRAGTPRCDCTTPSAYSSSSSSSTILGSSSPSPPDPSTSASAARLERFFVFLLDSLSFFECLTFFGGGTSQPHSGMNESTCRWRERVASGGDGVALRSELANVQMRCDAHAPGDRQASAQG